ncbi:MAG: ethylbenzene dehydrogenase-related protein [Chloroflexota bacterium]
MKASRVSSDVSDPLGAAWNDIPALTVSLDPEVEDTKLPTVAGIHYGAIPEVKLQASYDDKTIWIRATWADSTVGDVRNTWVFDGNAWAKNGQDQDRLAFAFDITGNAQFVALGCGAVCHTADTKAPDFMGFPVENSTDAVDVWQWKASQTGPANYADDQWLGSYVDENGSKAPVSDASTGTATVANSNKAGDGPAFVYPAGAQPGSPLFADSAVPFDASMTFPAGYTVPGYVVSRPAGSRGDINAQSVHLTYTDGTGSWNVVLSRPFDTANQEDHVFALNSTNVFGVAVFNNGGDKEHATHDKVVLMIGS